MVGLFGRMISPPQGRYLHRTTQTQKKRRHPCLEWDSNPVFERGKTFRALDRAATVIGILKVHNMKIVPNYSKCAKNTMI
jgi:hypothetical protein